MRIYFFFTILIVKKIFYLQKTSSDSRILFNYLICNHIKSMSNYTYKKYKYVKFFLLIFSIFSISSFPNLKLKAQNFISEKDQIENKEQTLKNNYYILGSGDILNINFEDFPEYNSTVKIQNDGSINLPKVGKINVQNLILEEVNSLALKKYSEIMINPIIEINLIKNRPIKVFFTGEVTRPGLYKLTQNDLDYNNYFNPASGGKLKVEERFSIDNSPTLYEGIKIAQGITDETDLENIELRRKIPEKFGGGYKKTSLNLLSIFIDGDDKNNINLMDGDIVLFKKSQNKIAKQIMQASRNNLNPSTISVYVTGRVRSPGLKSLKYGSTLNEAIAVAGGPKSLRGKIQLISSKNDKLNYKTFRYKPNKLNSLNNPTLKSGDIVRIGNSALSAGTELFSELLPPIIGVGTVNNLLN